MSRKRLTTGLPGRIRTYTAKATASTGNSVYLPFPLLFGRKPGLGQQKDLEHWASKDLVGHWIFNENSGTVVNDCSGNNNNGTLENVDGSVWGSGELGGCLHLDGSNDIVTIPDNSTLQLTGNYSIIAYIYLISQPSTFPTIFSDGVWRLSLGIDNITRKQETWINNSVGPNFSNTPVPQNEWHQIGIVGNGSTITFYLDGKSDGSFSYTQMNTPSTKTIGGMPSDSRTPFHGKIDNIRIYNKELLAWQVEELYFNTYAEYKKDIRLGEKVSSQTPTSTIYGPLFGPLGGVI